MHIRTVESLSELSAVGADVVSDVVARKPEATIIVATGETPMGIYATLANRRRQGKLETGALRAVQLDAYLGLSEDDSRSLYGWMKRSFVDPLELTEQQVVRLPGDDPDPESVCARYEQNVLDAGGIDLSILGLGPNGHLGFNEPPCTPDAPTRIVTLTEASIESNARYWGGRDQVPRRAITAGMNVLLAARQTILVVSGAHKRDILRRVVQGPTTPDVPASFLQQARNVTVLADRAASDGLNR